MSTLSTYPTLSTLFNRKKNICNFRLNSNWVLDLGKVIENSQMYQLTTDFLTIKVYKQKLYETLFNIITFFPQIQKKTIQ